MRVRVTLHTHEGKGPPMTHRTLLAATLLALAACTQAPPAPAEADAVVQGDPAVALVQRFNMGQGLKGLALDAARTTTTYAALVQRRGQPSAEKEIEAAIVALLPRYQSEWDRRLAALYARHLSADELRSLARDGKQSEYASRFNKVQPVVAAQMREQSSALLAELVTEALSAGA